MFNTPDDFQFDKQLSIDPGLAQIIGNQMPQQQFQAPQTPQVTQATPTPATPQNDTAHPAYVMGDSGELKHHMFGADSAVGGDAMNSPIDKGKPSLMSALADKIPSIEQAYGIEPKKDSLGKRLLGGFLSTFIPGLVGGIQGRLTPGSTWGEGWGKATSGGWNNMLQSQQKRSDAYDTQRNKLLENPGLRSAYEAAVTRFKGRPDAEHGKDFQSYFSNSLQDAATSKNDLAAIISAANGNPIAQTAIAMKYGHQNDQSVLGGQAKAAGQGIPASPMALFFKSKGITDASQITPELMKQGLAFNTTFNSSSAEGKEDPKLKHEQAGLEQQTKDYVRLFDRYKKALDSIPPEAYGSFQKFLSGNQGLTKTPYDAAFQALKTAQPQLLVKQINLMKDKKTDTQMKDFKDGIFGLIGAPQNMRDMGHNTNMDFGISSLDELRAKAGMSPADLAAIRAQIKAEDDAAKKTKSQVNQASNGQAPAITKTIVGQEKKNAQAVNAQQAPSPDEVNAVRALLQKDPNNPQAKAFANQYGIKY